MHVADTYPLGRGLNRRRIGSFLFVEHEYPARSERSRHWHPWLHLAIVLRGGYVRSHSSTARTYTAGSAAFIPAHEPHSDSYAPGAHCLHLLIPAELEQTLRRDLAGICPRGESGALTPSIAAVSAVALHREFRAPDATSPAVVEAVLIDLVTRALHLSVERASHRPPWLGTVLDYLDCAFDAPWTLADIAAIAGVHPAYLCRVFSSSLGCTLGEYIRGLRVVRGWQLLSLSDAAIAEVASRAGFTDQSHFTRAFRSQYGVTPARFRRSHRCAGDARTVTG